MFLFIILPLLAPSRVMLRQWPNPKAKAPRMRRRAAPVLQLEYG